jgi:hypothetical protein
VGDELEGAAEALRACTMIRPAGAGGGGWAGGSRGGTQGVHHVKPAGLGGG